MHRDILALTPRRLLVAAIVAAFVPLGCGEGLEGPGQSEAGKGDWVGNDNAGDYCRWDWECQQDQGHVCRPELQPWPFQNAPERVHVCGLPSANGKTCDEPGDCLSGICQNSVCGEPAPAPAPAAPGQGWAQTTYSPYCETSQGVCTLPSALPLGSPCSCGADPGRVIP